ncbi:hypothetical protein G6F23_014966 [Rhizopus arrhizus]|nr:hypothetical protein G6F23_014966 [Rhizopus arrhizus]
MAAKDAHLRVQGIGQTPTQKPACGAGGSGRAAGDRIRGGRVRARAAAGQGAPQQFGAQVEQVDGRADPQRVVGQRGYGQQRAQAESRDGAPKQASRTNTQPRQSGRAHV